MFHLLLHISGGNNATTFIPKFQHFIWNFKADIHATGIERIDNNSSVIVSFHPIEMNISHLYIYFFIFSRY